MNNSEQRHIARDLHDNLVAYWHDVDFNWGSNAGSHYTDDAAFVAGETQYKGREEIEEFYLWRKDRGARVNVHLVGNFHCEFESETRVNASWICTLFAHDGEAPQTSAPPISITKVDDIYVRDHAGNWLCERRTWHSLFRGGAPATVMSSEELASRQAGKNS